MTTLRTRSIALALACALGLPHAAAAAPVTITAADQRDVMITVYNGNLGLVKETREVRLDSGLVEARYADVAAQIDPTSVHLRSLTEPTALRILEQNYEYDLLSRSRRPPTCRSGRVSWCRPAPRASRSGTSTGPIT